MPLTAKAPILRCRAGAHRLISGAILGLSTIWFGATVSYAETDCTPPARLQLPSGASRTASSYAALGSWFGENKRYDCANRAFESALHLEPRSAKLNYFLGLSLYASGRAEAAIAPLTRSTRLDSKAMPPRVLLATLLQELGRTAEADEQWRAVLKLDPDSPEALDGLANSLMASGDAMAAIDLLKKVKRNEDLNLDLARAYGMAGMLEESTATVEEAMAAKPDSPRLAKVLATTYVMQGRYQDAAALLKSHLDRDPGNFEFQVFYLRVLVLNRDDDKARELGRKLLSKAPRDFDVLDLNGILERENGDYASARDHLQEAVKLDPSNYSARYNLGAALAHLDDAAGAKQQLEKAIALDGKEAEAHFQLASVLRSLGESEAAQEQLRLYQEISTASVTHALADTKAKQAAQKADAGDYQQAASLYRESLNANPDNAYREYRLASALHETSDFKGEREALERAVKIDPTFALAQNALGSLLLQNNGAAAAEEHFRQAVKAAPAFADAWVNLAATLASESRMPEAQEALATALRLEPANAQALQLKRELSAAAHR